MKKLFLILAVIGLASFGCTKVDTIIPTVKKVGVIDGSFTAQYGDISIAKDYSSPVAGWNMWTLLRKDGSKVDGTEFITGSAEQIWWSTNGNNPKALPAGTPYSILIPDEDLRLQLEVLDPTGHETVYFGITDFNPETVQFPLSIKAIRVGDYLSLNTDAITSLPGANLTITANFQLANVDIPTTANKVWNPALSFGFDDIKYGSLVPTTVTVGSGDFVLYSGNKKKVFGDITIKITEAASSSTPANTYTITVPANKVGIAGKGTALKLTTTKVGWYDSATIGVTDNDISIDVINVSVDGQDNQNGNGGGNNQGGGNNGGQLPPVHPSITLNAFSAYQMYNGPSEPDGAIGQLGIFLAMDVSSDQALITTQINGGASIMNNGEIIDMGQKDLISLLQNDHNYLQGPPTSGYSSSVFLIIGHSYIIRYREATNYQTSNSPYHYGIFYVTSWDVDNQNHITGVVINYEGPFDN